MAIKLKDALATLFTALTLVPLLVFWAWPYSTVLQSEYDEVRERHLLLARNLGAALERYHRDVRAVFDTLVVNLAEDREVEGATELLANLAFRHICLADQETGRVLAVIAAGCPAVVPKERFAIFQDLARTDGLHFTGVREGPGGLNLIYLVRRVGTTLAIGALRTDYFVELGKSISFGIRGHAVITDQEGNLLAHPIDQWAAERRNIAEIPVVQRMLRGETGIAVFHSPAFNGDMIAGFTSVKSAGWGVMIPQPVVELQAKADAARHSALAVMGLGALVAALLGLWVARLLSRPLDDIGEAARKVARGDLTVGLEVGRGATALAELAQVRQSFNEMVDRLRASMQRINQLAYVDTVTGLANRECLRAQTRAFMTERRGRKAALLFIDLDCFKSVNDEYGHEIGDAVLGAFADRLRRRFGSGGEGKLPPPADMLVGIDKPATDRPVIARLSGDEFALFVPDVGTIETIEAMAAAVLALLVEDFLIEGCRISIGASVGAARFPEDGADFAALLKTADIAMYAAKRAGKSRFVLFDCGLRQCLEPAPEPSKDRRQVRSR